MKKTTQRKSQVSVSEAAATRFEDASREPEDEFTPEELRSLARFCTANRKIQDARGRLVLMGLALDDKRDALAHLEREETRHVYGAEISELEKAQANQADELQALERVRASRLEEVEAFAHAETVCLIREGRPTAQRKEKQKS